jgi:hypothetical protein
MLKPVDIQVPGARVTWNALYHTSNPCYLNQDLLLVELPNNIFIDVSWFPEHDPHGEYYITIFQGDWEHQINTWKTRSLSDVISLVQRIAQQFLPIVQGLNVPWTEYSCSTAKYGTFGGILVA